MHGANSKLPVQHPAWPQVTGAGAACMLASERQRERQKGGGGGLLRAKRRRSTGHAALRHDGAAVHGRAGGRLRDQRVSEDARVLQLKGDVLEANQLEQLQRLVSECRPRRTPRYVLRCIPRCAPRCRVAAQGDAAAAGVVGVAGLQPCALCALVQPGAERAEDFDLGVDAEAVTAQQRLQRLPAAQRGCPLSTAADSAKPRSAAPLSTWRQVLGGKRLRVESATSWRLGNGAGRRDISYDGRPGYTPVERVKARHLGIGNKPLEVVLERVGEVNNTFDSVPRFCAAFQAFAGDWLGYKRDGRRKEAALGRQGIKGTRAAGRRGGQGTERMLASAYFSAARLTCGQRSTKASAKRKNASTTPDNLGCLQARHAALEGTIFTVVQRAFG